MATVIFKPTEECNSRCIYCDVINKEHQGPKKMSLEILEKFFFRINEFLEAQPDEYMQIVWHGGEPLLLGPDYFEQAIAFQERHCAATSGRIGHTIQSNLTLFNSDYARILRRLGVTSLGTSFEFLEHIRGFGPERDSASYNKKFMEAIRLADQEGFSWGVIYVVTRPALAKPLETFQFMANLAPTGAFMFNPVLLYHQELEHLKVTPEEYADFLGAIFPVWWENREQYGPVEPFFTLTRNLLGVEKSLVCCDSGDCAHSHVNLLPDGSLSHCGRSGDWGLLHYGSIFDKTFLEVFQDPQREILLSRNSILFEGDCADCRFWEICHGGCPLDAWSAHGSYLRKTVWCEAKRGFLEKYVEPIVLGPSSPVVETRQVASAPATLDELDEGAGPLWINPLGGLGDTLMLSGVLKQVVEREPGRRFNLVARTKYRQILEGHPAIGSIGHPGQDAVFLSTNYWDRPEFQLPGARAYQVLARIFGLETPVEERLFVPFEATEDPVLMQLVPWKQRNILVCQSSDSPRKQLSIDHWEALVAELNREGFGVVQVGKLGDPYIRGSYSLIGLTTIQQLIALLPRFDAVITADNFVMHAAHLCRVPAVVLWGPTDHRVYGYPAQVHFQATPHCEYPEGCIGPGRGDLYRTDCPQGVAHCVDTLLLPAVQDAVRGLLQQA